MKRLLPFLFLVALTAQAQLQLQIVGGVTNLLAKSGDTSTGPQLTTSASTNAPSATEFVTAGWVRGLVNQGFFEYASTNVISGTNADSPNQFLYEFHMQHIPDSAVRVWPNTFLTNGGYVGSVSTTNTFQSIAGQILVNAYIGLSSGGGDALSLKPEIYLSTDRSNWYGDFDCSAQAITPGITQLYSFVVSFPAQTATNPAGFYIERRLKVVSKGGSPTMYFLVGTNAISGTNSASHISINAAPVQGGTFSGVFIGNGYGLTNIPQSAITNAIPALTNGDTRNISFSGSNYQSGTVTFSGYAALSNSVLVTKGICFGTNIPTLNVDFSAGNYTFVATNNAFPISGFINYTNGLVCWQVLSYSNSAATAQTFSWPAGVLLYGTNSGTSISVASAKVLKAMISVDPHGTNLCAVQSN